ncbi:MAG TPA: cell division protein ZapA [Geobacteraceae bacterium]
MKTTHLVTVLGREISVRSSAPAEKVQAVEAFVNERLLEIGGALRSGDAQLVLTLALLNTAEELLELRGAERHDPSLEARLRGFIDRLETA